MVKPLEDRISLFTRLLLFQRFYYNYKIQRPELLCSGLRFFQTKKRWFNLVIENIFLELQFTVDHFIAHITISLTLHIEISLAQKAILPF
jgi:hypothetical protein